MWDNVTAALITFVIWIILVRWSKILNKFYQKIEVV